MGRVQIVILCTGEHHHLYATVQMVIAARNWCCTDGDIF